MKEELQKTFDDYLDRFESDESVCEGFKKLLLEQIGLGPVLEPVMQRYIEIAERKAYAYALPLGYAMMFYIYYGRNLDLAIHYNELAREMFMRQPDYKEHDGILTVANNALLGHIFKGDYGAAYQEILAAMPIAEKGGQITYYSAFLNNGAIILREFGLYKKAIQQVEETLEKRDFIGDSNFYTTVFLLCGLYLAVKDTAKVKKLLDTYVPELQQTGYFDVNIFNLGYLDAAILEDDRELADELYQKFITSYDFTKGDDMDNGEVYFTLGRYHMYRKEYEQALKYYKLLLDYKGGFFGHKRQLLEEAAKLYDCLGDQDKAYCYLQSAHELTKTFISFIDDIYHKEIEDVWEQNRRLSYEVMYDRLLVMTEFGKVVTSCLTWQQLLEVITLHAGRIFSFDEWHLLFYDEPLQRFGSLDHESYDLADHPLLALCVSKNSAYKLGNWNAETDLAKRLGKLYDEHSRSMLIQPVSYQGELLALFCMKSNQIENYSRTDQGLLQIFADYIAIAIHNVKQYSAALEKSSYDYLSGIYNRSALMKYGEGMLQCADQEKHSIGALMIDIDDFKKINDSYGHMQGDRVICAVTDILKQHQQQGIIARFGGEEFILLIDSLSEQALYELAERIRYACETNRVSMGETAIHYTISIGCCYRECAPKSLHELFDEADQRMYIAKRNGKNCVQM